MLIDVTMPETLPRDATNIIEIALRDLPDVDFEAISEAKIQQDYEVTPILERYFSPNKASAERMYYDLISVYSDYSLLCYHATRITHTVDFSKNGLREFSLCDYEKALLQFLSENQLDGNATKTAMELIRHEVDRKYSRMMYPHRTCFFTPFTDFYSSDCRPGYDQFVENIGGEIARFALRDRMPDVFSLLKSNGTPVVVKASVECRKISAWDIRRVIYQFIIAMLAKMIWNYDYTIRTDFSIIGDVEPQNILEVIPVDYLDKHFDN